MLLYKAVLARCLRAESKSDEIQRSEGQELRKLLEEVIQLREANTRLEVERQGLTEPIKEPKVGNFEILKKIRHLSSI